MFSSRKQTVTEFNAGGDGALIEIDFTAVVAADFANGMKAGETISLKGRSEVVFRDHKIYRLTDYS